MDFWICGHGASGRIKIERESDSEVYCDNLNRNQDPYIWHERFVNTFCKSKDLWNVKKGDVVFWVIPYPNGKNLEKLYCDLVFKVDKVLSWKENNEELEDYWNKISMNSILVENNLNLYNEHFLAGIKDHPKNFNRSQRSYLKGTKDRKTRYSTEDSFQPQGDGELVDLLKVLEKLNLSETSLKEFIIKSITDRKKDELNAFIVDKDEIELVYSYLSNSTEVKRIYPKFLKGFRESTSWDSKKVHKFKLDT